MTKTGPCKINSQFDIFFENLSRILNLNLSNGGERNSMKLGFKISADNGVQLDIEIKREGGRVFWVNKVGNSPVANRCVFQSF